MEKQKKGKFITIYGINGIGKTTQVELLVKFLKEKGLKVSRLKYPIYDLEPEGPFIHKYLREPEFRAKNPQTTNELQEKYAENRRRYEKTLKERLEEGEWIVAEDYVGTGLAWGLTWGGDLEYLEKINEDLYPADISILMHGNRFETAIEKGHRNEGAEERIQICKNFHFLLAERYDWKIVNANQEVEEVSEEIKEMLKGIVE